MPNASPSPQDPDWNNNNLAHTDTWLYLLLYEELRAVFWDARDIKMSELTFFNSATSPSMREVEARKVAARLDRAYRMKSRATFEDGWDLSKAVEALKDILVDGDKKVYELAAKVDEIYSFIGEHA